MKLETRCKNNDLLLIISDHGPGIDAVHLKRLTEVFYRVDSSRELNSGGLGLGLYLCQAMIDSHRGSLNINSTPAPGRVVECRIPAVLL